MCGYEPFQPAQPRALPGRVSAPRRVLTLWAAVLVCGLNGCASDDAEPAAGGGDVTTTGIGPLGKLAAAPLPPKGQVGLEVSSWILRAGAPGVIDQLVIAGQVLPGPPAPGLDGVSAGVWSASGLRVFRVSASAWGGIEASIVRTPVAPPVAEGELPKLPDPNAPSGIIGPRTWMPDGADWTELARGSPLLADQVLALHDGRFRAPASTPRLLARAFSVWNPVDSAGAAGDAADGGSRLVVEIVPQLLGVRKQDADLDLMNPKLASQWSRGQVLDRLLGAVTVEAGQVLVITTSTGADVAMVDEAAPADDGISRPGRMRSGAAPAAPARRGLGPPVGPDAFGTGSPFGGGGPGGNMPAEARAVPTIGQAILAARQATPDPAADGRVVRDVPLARSFLVLKPAFAGERAKGPPGQIIK